MTISAQAVKELREKTGAGFMDCKKALTESEGDFDRAVKYLREKGLAAARKRSGREANEGLVTVVEGPDRDEILLVEVNCETDFVSRTDKFRDFVSELAQEIFKKGIETKDDIDDALDTMVKESAGTFGENIVLRRLVRFKKTDKEKSVFQSYIHLDGKAGVIVEFIVEPSEIKYNKAFLEFAKNISLQIASMSPVSVSRDDFPVELIEEQKGIFIKQARESGKPEKIIDRIVNGKMDKFFAESCLLEQKYVKNSDITINQYREATEKEVEGAIKIERFMRFRLGEE